MLFADGAFGLIVLGLWLFCIIDVITTPDDSVRNLPKFVWLMIVILLFDIGCIAWLVAGRNWNGQASGGGMFGTGAQPRRSTRRLNGTNPDDDEEFLRGLRARAEEQRRRAREARTDDPPTTA